MDDFMRWNAIIWAVLIGGLNFAAGLIRLIDLILYVIEGRVRQTSFREWLQAVGELCMPVMLYQLARYV